jgi:hypothetical protein
MVTGLVSVAALGSADAVMFTGPLPDRTTFGWNVMVSPRGMPLVESVTGLLKPLMDMRSMRVANSSVEFL